MTVSREMELLLRGESSNPHGVLGAHPEVRDGVAGVTVRTMHPDAASVECILPSGEALPLEPVEGARGFFATFIPRATLPLRYRLRFHFPDGAVWER
ncbi:MAG TPA: hypothetical protein VFR95_09390, partial [Gemmatimonadaceae bacterium]|nr:hypothetical protein [Gemmatimonadaceae bacterium]